MGYMFPPVLVTRRLILRPLELGDAKDMFEYAGDPENTKYVLFDTHKTIYDSINFLSGAEAGYAKKASYDYAVVLKESLKMIGSGGCMDVGKFPHSAGIGYIINKRYWGAGYAPEAMSAIVKYFFEVLRIHRVEAFHLIDNPASGRVMQKIGMTLEGTHPDALFLRGEYRTIKRYGMINPGTFQGSGKD